MVLPAAMLTADCSIQVPFVLNSARSFTRSFALTFHILTDNSLASTTFSLLIIWFHHLNKDLIPFIFILLNFKCDYSLQNNNETNNTNQKLKKQHESAELDLPSTVPRMHPHAFLVLKD